MSDTSSEKRLELVGAVEKVYRAKLDAAARQNRDDPRFVSGLTHALACLDRVARALAGETDPVRLGLADPETAAPPAPVETGLFDVEAAS